jgi:AraC-like DNA-binding protein
MEYRDPLDRSIDRTRVAGPDPRARGAFALRVVMRDAWSIAVEDGAALSVLVVLEGGATLVRGDERVALRRGDVALLPVGSPYLIVDTSADVAAAAAAPLARILPGQACVSADGADLAVDLAQGVRTWGNAGVGGDRAPDTTLLIGTYEGRASAGRSTLEDLPPVAHVPDAAGALPAVDLLAAELGHVGVGQQTVVDRLLDVLVVTAVRAYRDAAPGFRAGWLAGVRDPVVDAAAGLIHAFPGRAWTIDVLAREVLVSRSTLAARFTRAVGVPPMTYLSQWRLDIACDLLADPGTTVASTAETLGYASPFSFSAAFRRRHGTSPSGYRRRILADGG